MQSYDLVAHLLRQRAFSRATFGPGMRTKGVVDHIRKELIEIEDNPRDITEWIDVVLLALDGAWRCAEAINAPIEIVVGAIEAKQSKNERRDWPDWRSAYPDKAIEHIDVARQTFTVPAGHEAVRDADGRATGEFRPKARMIICPKAKAGVPRRTCLYPQCDCDAVIGGPGRC